MCGIFAYYGKDYELQDIQEQITSIRYRGPDSTSYSMPDRDLLMAFHRLSIVGIDNGNQPLRHPADENLSLICNGEIYNYKELISKFGFESATDSDCEVILHLYEKFGIAETVTMLDGVFAFVLYDENTKTLYSARDTYGVRPSFIGYRGDDIIIASEAKAVAPLCSKVLPFPPATWWSSAEPNAFISYKNTLFRHPVEAPEQEICNTINTLLTEAVDKRMMSEREIGCLLSGGLDSSLIAALVSRNITDGKLKTFSIGMPGSIDVEYARKVAKHIDSDHHEVVISPEEFIDAIETVIYHTESYDTTTVRASVGNYLVSKYIRENTDCKVVFNGDGSDEVCMGYVYNQNAPNEREFYEENNRLLDEIYLYDVLRSDRSISSNGLEPRTPFLDKKFVDFYMRVPPHLKMFNGKDRIEKYLLRKAFAEDNLLPEDVLWRAKCAFSDGVSNINNSWHKIIQKYVDSKVTDEEFHVHKLKIKHCPPVLKESYYYRKMFNNMFQPSMAHLIPRFWMPRWTNTKDPSARELSNYKE